MNLALGLIIGWTLAADTVRVVVIDSADHHGAAVSQALSAAIQAQVQDATVTRKLRPVAWSKTAKLTDALAELARAQGASIVVDNILVRAKHTLNVIVATQDGAVLYQKTVSYLHRSAEAAAKDIAPEVAAAVAQHLRSLKNSAAPPAQPSAAATTAPAAASPPAAAPPATAVSGSPDAAAQPAATSNPVPEATVEHIEATAVAPSPPGSGAQKGEDQSEPAEPDELAELESMPTTSRLGTRGIERLESAWPTAKQDVVITAGGDAYHGKGLLAANDTDTQFHEQLFVTWAPLTGLDLTASQAFASNDDTVWKPAGAVQTVGDPTIGAKYGLALTPGFALAGAVRAMFPSSAQERTIAFKATSVTALVSASVRPSPFVGLTLNAGYLNDRSAQITSTGLTPAQRFALGVSQTSQVLAGLGVETDLGPTDSVRIGPFAEVTSNIGIGARLRNDPIRATLGTKVQLIGPNRLEISLGADIALSGIADAAGSNMAGIPPWAVFARIAGHLGKWTMPGQAVNTSCTTDADCSSGMSCLRGTCGVVQTVVQQVVQAPASYMLTGKVYDRTSKTPIDIASITISGYEKTPLAVNAKSGEYVSFALPCGEGLVQLTATAYGYHPTQKVVPKGADHEVVTVDFPLQATSEKLTADLRGTLKDAATGTAISGVIFIPTLNLKTETDEGGRFHVVLGRGRFQVLISAPRYLTQKKDIVVQGGDTVIMNVDMTSRSK